MTVPYYTDESVTLYHGNALDVLWTLPSGSVDCCVTSPPYFGLRDYGVEGQLGLEASPAEYVENLRAVFAQVRRVLTDDGTCWLNLGDSYSGNRGNVTDPGADNKNKAVGSGTIGRFDGKRSLPDKNLMGIPWRVAFALQDDGWILRNAIVWNKPNAMPESVTDRLSTRYEMVFLLTKSTRYWFDLDPIREPLIRPEALFEGQTFNNMAPGRLNVTPCGRGSPRGVGAYDEASGFRSGGHVGGHRGTSEGGKNPGDVWSITTSPTPFAHFATFPLAIPSRAIQAGCKPGGTVLDPFSGSGTTGLAAARHGRRYVGIDLSAEYLDLSLRTRLMQPGLDFGTTA